MLSVIPLYMVRARLSCDANYSSFHSGNAGCCTGYAIMTCLLRHRLTDCPSDSGICEVDKRPPQTSYGKSSATHSDDHFVPSNAANSRELRTWKEADNPHHVVANQQGERHRLLRSWTVDPIARTSSVHPSGPMVEPTNIEKLMAVATDWSARQSVSSHRHCRPPSSPTPAKTGCPDQPPKSCTQPKDKGHHAPRLACKIMKRPSEPKRPATDKKIVCSFQKYGCSRTFTNRNEEARHFDVFHMQLGTYRCDKVGCVEEFNRKDLFVMHQRRMHAPWSGRGAKRTASKEEKEAFEKSLESLCDRCWQQIRKPPNSSSCRVCGRAFVGPGSWKHRMRHVRRCYERANSADEEREDHELREWALDQGILHEVNGEVKLKLAGE